MCACQVQALRVSSAEHVQRGPARPWQLGWQVNERNLVWNDDLKLRLIKVCRFKSGRCSLCQGSAGAHTC